MAARQIITEIIGDASKLNSALNSATGSTTKFGNILQGVGQGIGQKAFGLIENAVGNVVGAVEGAVRAAEDYEVVSTRLSTALRTNVAGWDGNRTAIDAFLKSQTDLGFGVGETTAAMAQLVTATGDVAKAQTYLSTAEDLSRLTGNSLADSSAALTKVDAGSLRILKSIGIELPKNASAAQALAAVQKVVSGQAIQYANTEAGAKDKLKAKNEELAISLGDKLLPVANLVTEAQIKLVDSTIDVTEKFTKLSDVLTSKTAPSLQKTADQSHSLNDIVKLITGGLVDFSDKVDLMDRGLGIAADTTKGATANWAAARTGLGWLGDAAGSAARKTDALTAAMVAAQPPTAAEADAMMNLVDSALAVPDTKKLTAWMSKVGIGANNLAGDAKDAYDKMWKLLHMDVTGGGNFDVNLSLTTGKGPKKKFAAGGAIGPGETAIAGEAGLELVTGGSSGATVTPFSKLGHGFGSSTVINHFHIGGLVTDGPALDRFATEITRRMRYASGI